MADWRDQARRQQQRGRTSAAAKQMPWQTNEQGVPLSLVGLDVDNEPVLQAGRGVPTSDAKRNCKDCDGTGFMLVDYNEPSICDCRYRALGEKGGQSSR